MSENSNKQIAAQDRQEGPSRNRRLLLKAAASAAPLIATLPSGAAFANASAAACVIKDKTISEEERFKEIALLDDEGNLPDNAVRYAAWQRRINCDGKTYFYVYAGGATGWYDQDGEPANNPPPPLPDPPTERGCGRGLPPGADGSGDVKVYVLAHWIPEDDFGGVHPSGFFPVTNINVDDNMGITASCLCSVDAGYLPEHEQHWCKRA